jgi:transposase
MKPYSNDLRLRVLSAIDSGKPRKQDAKTFSVSMPTIKDLVLLPSYSPNLNPIEDAFSKIKFLVP